MDNNDVDSEIIERGLLELVELITPQRMKQIDFSILDMDEVKLLLKCSLLKLKVPRLTKGDIRLHLGEEDWTILKLTEKKVEDAEKHFKGPINDSEIYVRLANALMLTGNVEKAEHFLDRAVEIEPRNGIVWHQLGAVLDKLGRFEEAMRCFDRATRYDPDLPVVWMSKASALSDLGNEEEALKALEKAAELEPDNPEVWQELGNKLYNLGRFSEAKESYEKANYIKGVVGEVAEKEEMEIPKEGMLAEDKNLIKKSQSILERGKKLGADVSEAEVFYKTGQEETEKGRYEEALEHMKVAITEAERAIRKRVEEAVETAEKKVSYAKVYVTVDKADLILNQAKDLMEGGNFEEALEMADRTVYTLEITKKEHKSAANAIQNSWAKISEAKEKKADTSTAEALLKEARDALKKGEYGHAKEFADQSIKQIVEPKALLGKTCAAELMEIRTKLVEAERIGIDISELWKKLEKADALFDQEEFEESQKVVKQLMEDLENTRDEYYMKNTVEMMMAVRSAVGEMRGYGFGDDKTIANVETTLDLCEKHFEEKQFKEAYDKITKAHLKVQEMKADFIMKERDKLEGQFRDILMVLKQVRANTSPLESIYNLYQERVSEGKMEEAFDNIKRALSNANDMIKKIHDEQFSELMRKVEGRLIDLEKTAKDHSLEDEYGELTHRAEAIKKKDWGEDYMEAISGIVELMESLDELEMRGLTNRFNKYFGRIEAEVQNMKDLGIDVKDMENMLKTSLMLKEEGEWEDAMETLKNIESLMGQKDMRRRMEYTAKKLNEIMDMINILRERGQSVDTYEKEHDHIKRLFASKEYLEAENSVNELYQRLDKTISKIKREEALEAVRQGKLELDNMEDIKIPEAEKEIHKAEEAIEAEDYDLALEMVENAHQLINKESTRLRAMNTLKNTKEMIKDFEREGMDLSNVKKVFESARPLMEVGNYGKAIEIADEAKSMMKNIEKELKSKSKSVIDAILEVQGMIVDIKSKGGKVAEMEGIVAEARSRYHKKDHKGAIKLLSKARKEANNMKELRELISELKDIRGEIDLAKEEGIEVERVEEVFKKAEPALRKKDFKKVRKIVDKIREVLDILKKKKELEDTMGEVVKRFNMLSSKGVKFNIDMDEFQRANGMLKNYKIEEAEKLISSLNGDLETIEKNYLEVVDIISGAQLLIKQAKKRGIPTVHVEGKMRKVVEHLAKGEYGTALGFAEEIELELEETLEVGGDLSDMISLIEIKFKELKDEGITTRELETKVERIKVKMERGELKQALTDAEDLLEDIERFRQRHEELVKKADFCKAMLDLGRKQAVDTARAHVYFDQSILARNRGDYQRTEELLDNVINNLKEKGMEIPDE